MSSVKVSVVLCTYNGGLYLREQLDSLLNQSFMPYEILIQDDQSTDDTWQIIEEYKILNACIKSHQNSQRLGLNQNFITAFFKASGDYIAISDQDDVWQQDKLDLYVKALHDKDCCFVYSDSFITDSKLTVTGRFAVPDHTLIDLVWMGLAPGHSVLFKKDVLLGLKNLHQIDFIYDWLVGLTALSVGQAKKIDQPATYWRRHDTTVGRQDFKPVEYEYLKPYQLLFRVFKSLLMGKKLKNFSWQYENISLILNNFDNLTRVKAINKFVTYYKQEKPWTMVIACFIYLRLHQHLKIKDWIKSVYVPLHKYYFYKYTGAGLRG
ncbi:glycosyltransferase [Spirosoma endbachense]|uniref:Glycosyltransferase n=1 Tax=Spirosoma endbachense TaxID=2666025 RepID=A0A6P1VV75_9BACT|nr:glycosyltransferase [Spirosoma endbachense]QHV95276.1 glycosyltransferase [Spirosoma endbachense]